MPVIKGSDDSTISGAVTVQAPVSLLNINVVPEKAKCLIETFGLNKMQSDNRVIPEFAKKNALYKVDLIIKWIDYREEFKNKTSADKKFEELYNSGLIAENLHKKLGSVSIKTIYRWHKDWASANEDWQALVCGYAYGSATALRTSLTDIEKYFLLKFMLHQNQYALADAYELIKIELKKMGVTEIASEMSYRRVWNYVCKNYADKVVFARQGLKAALDTKLPCLKRNSATLNVGDILVGDGHVLDFNIINPKSGKGERATLVGFIDWASWNFVGYEIMFTENTQSIASALRNSIITLGKMPKVVYIDNGRAFKNKTFNGEECGIQGIYAKLGIKTMFSKPYNGRSKIVERFWEELTGSLAKLMPSYIGNTIANKPAYTKRNEKFHGKIKGEFVPTIEETKAIIEGWLNAVYRERSCPNHRNLTIGEYFNQNTGKGIDINLLDDLLMSSEERQVGRNGISLFNQLYYAPELTGLNMSVVAKYNMLDLSYIKVYTKKGEYICKAERTVTVKPAAELLGSPKDLQEYKQQQKQISNIYKQRIKPTKQVLADLYGKYKLPNISNHVPKIEEREIKPAKYKITCYEDLDDTTDKVFYG